jgi:beta-galactosidase
MSASLNNATLLPRLHTGCFMSLRSAAVLVVLSAAACHHPATSAPAALAFPKGFLFGAATAGFQVEMGCPTVAPAECEDRNSDWYQWITDPRILADPKAVNFVGGPPSTGPGFFELYAQDFDRARKDLKLGAVRLSIEWSRIFPTSTVGVTGNDALKAMASANGIAFYHSVFAAMKQRGLKPLVTLNHYTLPLWIHDGADCHFNHADNPDACPLKGWLDPNTITEIAKYAGFVAHEYGGEVDLWATENEPLALPLSGYLQAGADRTNPPGFDFKAKDAKTVTMALIQAHARMYDAVKLNDTVDADGDGTAAQVGLVFNLAAVKAATASDDDTAAATNIHYLYDQLFLDATIKGDLDETASGESAQVHHPELAGRMDYLGVNYYSQLIVAGLPGSALPDFSPLLTLDPTSPNTSLYNFYSKGIYETVMFATQRYHIPIYITENGVTKTDAHTTQESGMAEMLQWLHKAIQDGADVRGYFWWSLTDNYEWNHGMAADQRFGLYAIDPMDAQKTRTLRPVGQEYGGVAASGSVSAELVAKYPLQ